MVRVVLERHLGDIRYDIVVPDSATPNDELEIVMHHIKFYLEKERTVLAALETLHELAEDDPNIEHILKNEFIENILRSRAAAYDKIAMDLILWAASKYELKKVTVGLADTMGASGGADIGKIMERILEEEEVTGGDD